MSKKYLVTYDVKDGESDDYSAIDEALEKHGTIQARQGSSRWLKDSGSTAQAVLDAVVKAVKPKRATVWVLEAASGADRAFTE
ncbi:MAG: hypothetical protein H6742_12855 [Alphaproteobacteria bacterium]|nr:hypothetical protein [Alphaproteobacteria bacterium]